MISKIARLVFASAMLLLVSGCMNLYVRCPFTNATIDETYMCTKEAAAYSYVIMFPQVMSPNSARLLPENAITIPIGCICFIDVACEVILDTLLWPADKVISSSRSR